LESSWTVSYIKEYYQGFKQLAVGIECSLPFISGLDTHVIEAPADIELGEVLGFMEL